MSGRFFLSGTTPLFEGSAQPLSTFLFELIGTTTAQDTYSDSGLTTANTNPVVTDAYGYLGEVYLSRNRYKVTWKNANGTTLKTWASVDKDKIHTVGAGFPADPHPGQIHDNTSNGNRYEYKINSASWLLIGPTDSVGNAATVTESLTGTETAKFVTPDSLAAIWQRGSNITPSAGSVSLPSTGGGVFNIAAGNFSAISTGQGGRKVLFVFGGASVITHNATSMILPGGANITTEAGDVAEFTNEAAADASGANWRMTSWQPDSASGTPIPNYAASNAEQVTGSSLLKWVTPGTQHRHESAVKSWLNYAHDTATVNDSYAVTSVDDDGAGLFGVNMSITFGNTTYAVSGWARSNATTTMMCLTGSSTIVKTTTAIDLATRRGTDALGDCPEVGVNFVGTLA